MSAASGRPIFCIDPEDAEQVDRLCKALVEAMYRAGDRRSAAVGIHPATIEAALRSLIAPPKPEEPTGLGAVVEDAKGDLWIRRDGHGPNWLHSEGNAFSQRWADLSGVKVLSEGVTR